jgi:DNA-binding winged helix-turn-helix (wHTH) protein
VFDTLVLLVERHGELIGKAEMMQAHWPGVFVGGKRAHQKHFGPAKGSRRRRGRHGFIETIPKTGYRFVQPVEIVQKAGITRPAPAVFRTARWSPWLWVPVAIVLAAALDQ